MLKIRLSRVGRKNRPMFRVVLTQHSKPAKSGYIKSLGTWDPVAKKLEVNKKEITAKIKQGVALSDTVNNIFVNNKIILGDKVKTTKEKPQSEDKDQPKTEKASKKAEEAPEIKKQSAKDMDNQKKANPKNKKAEKSPEKIEKVEKNKLSAKM